MKIPKAYSSLTVKDIQESPDKYLNLVQQVKPVNHHFVKNKIPKTYSLGIEEIDDPYLDPKQQVKHINQRFDYVYSPFVKDYNQIDFTSLTTDQKLNLLFDTLTETKSNLVSMLTAVIVILIIVLLKVSMKK